MSEMMARSKLRAEAPEIFSALKSLLVALDDRDIDCGNEDAEANAADRLSVVKQRARTAIAKVEGKP